MMWQWKNPYRDYYLKSYCVKVNMKGTQTESQAWAAVVTQLVEQLLPIPEMWDQTPIIGIVNLPHLNCNESTINKPEKYH